MGISPAPQILKNKEKKCIVLCGMD